MSAGQMPSQLSYIGAIGSRGIGDRVLGRGGDTEAGVWRRSSGQHECFLHVRGSRFTVHAERSMVALVRGYAVRAGTATFTDQHEIAAEVCRHFGRYGELPVDRYEGSFTWVACDAEAGRLSIYRNLVGTGHTYYAQRSGELLFASNLVDLVRHLDRPPQPDASIRPVFFLFRSVPGKRTLFEGIERLTPGELLEHRDGQLKVCQHRTFADLDEKKKLGAIAVERVEATMANIMSDYAELDPRSANLLSGGVDSSYIQVHWNRAIAPRRTTPRSVAVTVDHSLTRADQEYAESAALALKTVHTNVPLNGIYQDCLTGAIAVTGEPPNHVQSGYFAPLARRMRELALDTGLCGEGADSLFGTDLTNRISRAKSLRAVVPSEPARFYLGMAAAALGRNSLAGALRLAGRVDDLADVDHPVNTVASFTHRSSVESCFGKASLSEACAYRRALLDRYQVPREPLQWSHAVGFLGEAMDTASLWTTLFESEGVLLRCPYLDSRLLRVALNIDPKYRFSREEPKWTLKQALRRHVPEDLISRQKLGFGQPIFEWMRAGGQLRPMIDRIHKYDFVPNEVFASARAEPNWFLFSLLCYDVWCKQFA